MSTRYGLVTTALALLFAWATGAQPAMAQTAGEVPDPGPDEHLLYEAGAVEWQDGPASLEPGARIAVLEGDPSEAGVFTLRLWLPDGYHIAPHWHPNVERVTVVSGTFHLGNGDVLNPEATTPMEPGSYTAMPPGMRHFAIAEGETVIQLTSVGPWVLRYVRDEDDPRRRE